MSFPEPEFSWTGPSATPEGEPEGTAEPFAEPTIPMYNTNSDTKTVMGVVASVMGTAIVLQNIIVLIVIAKVWPKQNPTITYFIIHLACADLAAGMQFIWFNGVDVFLMITHNGVWVLIMCGIWMVTISASIGGLINFAHLRIYVLKTAMKNEKYTKKRAIMTIALSWILPTIVLFIPPLAGWNCIGCHGDEYCTSKCSQIVFPFTKSYALLLGVLLTLALVWLTILYVWIFLLVHAKLQSVRNISSTTASRDTEKQLFTTMIIILSLFFVCHIPLAVILVFDFVIAEPNALLIDSFHVAVTVSFINSLLNPIVYYWRMPATRDAFWMTMGKRKKTLNASFYSSASANAMSGKNKNSVSAGETYYNKQAMQQRTAM